MLQISCDTLSRLIPVALDAGDQKCDEMFNVRLEDGLAIVTNNKILVIENVGGFSGLYYLKPDKDLLTQMTQEATLGGSATITPEMLITTYGYYCQPMIPVTESKFDKWRTLIEVAKEPLTKTSEFGTCWSAEQLKMLTLASPSKSIVFEAYVDPSVRPLLVCDLHDENWLAVSLPFTRINPTATAKYPKWLR